MSDVNDFEAQETSISDDQLALAARKDRKAFAALSRRFVNQVYCYVYS